MHFFNTRKKSKKSKQIICKFQSKDNKYLKEIKALRKTIPNWDNLFSEDVSDEHRLSQWIRLKICGESMVSKYAWAVPDEKSLNVIEHFQPLIEIGAGQGYWASLLQKRGVDIVPFDKNITTNNANGMANGGSGDNSPYTTIIKGTPKVLALPENQNKSLFLCYPDDSNGMANKCLKYFNGDIVIHVGEMLFTTGSNCGPPQSTWGKTTGGDFQVNLMENFHCIYMRKLDYCYPFSKDYISVWKRTIFIEGYTKELSTDNEVDEVTESDEEDLWLSVPVDEQIVLNAAAPCMKQFL